MRQLKNGGELQEMGASRVCCPQDYPGNILYLCCNSINCSLDGMQHEKFLSESPVSAFEDGVELVENGRSLIEISPDVVTRLGSAKVCSQQCVSLYFDALPPPSCAQTC